LTFKSERARRNVILWSKWHQEFHEFGPNKDQYLSCVYLTSNLAKSFRKPEIKKKKFSYVPHTHSRDDHYSNIDFTPILIGCNITVTGKL